MYIKTRERKALLICHAFSPSIGGVEQHVTSLARNLISQGFEVTIITRAIILKRSWRVFPKAISRYKKIEKYQGIKIIRCWFFGDFALHLAKEMSRSDIIHLHGPFIPYPEFLAYFGLRLGFFNITKILKSLFKKPVVTTMHGLHFRYDKTKSFIDEMAVDISDCTIAVDSEMYRDILHMHKRRVVSIPNGIIGHNSFRKISKLTGNREAHKFTIICPRRLDPKNGIEYALQAFSTLVCRSKQPIHMIVTGPCYSDSYEKYILDLAKDLKISDRVNFFNGFVHSELIKVIQSSEVAIFPSLWESTSIAALECLSLGVPIVAFETGGLKDIITHGFNGFLVPPKNYLALGDQILKLVNSEELLNCMSENAFLSSKDFTWESNIKKIISVYSIASNDYRGK